MRSPVLALPGAVAPRWEEAAPPVAGAEARLRALRDEHFEFVWRALRRLGVADADTDDAVQQVFITAAGKLDDIHEGSAKSFLFGVALRVASHARRSVKRRAEVGSEALDGCLSGTPETDELLDQRRARTLLDEVLQTLPLDVRAVFILFELEEMDLAEIAALLGIPRGTVASRLRRGRERFEAEIRRLQARPSQRRSER
jgi:RNA polymerase sigma-70 factor (ECF subfamily)